MDAPHRAPVGPKGARKIPALTAGIHTIALTGVAQNCTPSAANPNDALVRGAATTKISLVLRCVASGVLVTVTTVGIDADSNGYAVAVDGAAAADIRSEEHTSELQSQSNLVCRLLLEKKKIYKRAHRSVHYPS